MFLNNLTLRRKIIGGNLFILIIVCLGLGLVSTISVSNIILNQIRENIPIMAVEGARLVNSHLENNILAIQGIANRHVIRSMDWENQQLPALQNELNRLNYLGIGIIDLQGNAKYSDGSTASLGDRDYFQRALKGETVFSNVLISRVINAPVLMLATPIRDYNNQIAGILIARLSATILSDITDHIRYGKQGYSYIIDQNGTLVAHNNRNFVLEQRNFIQESKNDSQYTRLASMLERMTKGETGFDEYPFMGLNRYFGFAPIPGTSWSIAVGAIKNDVFAHIYRLRVIILVVSCLFILIGLVFAIVINKSIINSVNKVVLMLKDISEGEGDLTKRININSKDELGNLALYFNNFSTKLQNTIKKLSHSTNEISNSALDLLKTSNLTANLSNNMTEKTKTTRDTTKIISEKSTLIAASTEQASSNVRTVAAASVEMSSNFNTVAAGAEQASTNIETIVKAVNEISKNIKDVVNNIKEISTNTNNSASAVEEMSTSLGEVAKITIKAKHISDKAEFQANNTSTIMQELMQNAREIGSVVKIINDIADQTNMLALNATIEAASAGDAGKGFAVVANEVKTLAKQTAEATGKIQSKIQEMQNSTTNTVDSLNTVKDIIIELNSINSSIAASVEEQSATVNEISHSIALAAHNTNEVLNFAEGINTSAETANRNIYEAGKGINEIARNITESSIVANTVAKNSEEVSIGVEDIAKNITEINSGIIDISDNLDNINNSALETSQESNNVKDSSVHLEKLVTEIKKLLSQFKV